MGKMGVKGVINGAPTSLTINQVEWAIAKSDHFNYLKNTVLPNMAYRGILESDLLVLSKSGYLTEIEIKRTPTDLKADFKKYRWNNVDVRETFLKRKIKHFYYAVPIEMVGLCDELIEEHNNKLVGDDYDEKMINKRLRCGIISYQDNYLVKIEKPAPRTIPFLSEDSFKLFLEERLDLMRVGCMKIWNLKDKLQIMEEREIKNCDNNE